MPAPIKATGKVTTDDGAAVEGAKVRATQTDAEGEELHYEAYSGKDGTYTIDGLEVNNPITFSSPQKNVCPKYPDVTDIRVDSKGECEVPTRVVTSDADVVQDFEKPGCTAKIDFGTSMVAVGRCFKPTAREQWETDEPFRIDGIDFTPTGKVKFDKLARTVDFGTGAIGLSVEISGVATPLPAWIAPGVVAFETALTKFTFNAGAPLPANAFFAGYPMSEQATVEFGPGTASLSVKLTVPTDVKAQYEFLKNAFKDTKTFSLTAKLTTDNDFRARGIEGTLESPGNILGINTDSKFKNPLAILKNIKAGYDGPTRTWKFGGTLDPAFLKYGTTSETADEDKRGGSIEGVITGRGIPPYGTFDSLSASLDGFNKHLGDGVYLQRFKASGSLTSLTPTGTGSFSAGFGLSALPANSKAESVVLPIVGAVPKVPKEYASLDADATVSWTDLSSTDLNDLKINGTGTLKIWDQEVGRGTQTLYPVQGLAGLQLNSIGLTDPTGGSFFVARGEGEFWLDMRKEGRYYLGSRGNITLAGQGFTADWILTGPTPTIFATCGVIFGRRVGGAINFSRFGEGFGEGGAACDLAPYRALKPPLPAGVKVVTPPPLSVTYSRAAAARQTFKLRGDEGFVSFEVAGTGRGAGVPKVKLTGPGLSVVASGTKAVKTAKVATMITPVDRKLRVFLNKPRRGRYRLQVMGGGAKLRPPRFSRVLPEPQVETALQRTSCAPTIRWSAARIAGQTLRFVERNAAGNLVLGTSKRSRGALKITPVPLGGRAEVSVEVLNGDTVRRSQVIGNYTSALGATVTGPSGLKATKAGKVSWKPVCGAAAYSVVVRTGKRTSKPKIVTGTRARVGRLKRGAQVVVTSLGRGRVAGGSTLVPAG